MTTTARKNKSCPTSSNRFKTFKRKISVSEDDDEDEAPPRKISVFALGIGEENEARPRKISVFALGIGEDDETPPPPSAIIDEEDDLPALQELIVQHQKSGPKESPEPPMPKLEPKEFRFGNVDVFMFHIAQGLVTVPSPQVGSGNPLSLGMEEKHHAKYTFKLGEYANYKHNEKQFKYNKEEKMMEEQRKDEGGGIHQQHHFFNRLDERYRRALLIKEGVQIDESVVNETRNLLKSREQCGCRCPGGRCRPETCECAKNGIECQLDVHDEDNINNNFPCICTVEGCQNPIGRIQLDQVRIRQHQIQTIMRIRAARKLGSDWDDEKSSPQHTIFHDK